MESRLTPHSDAADLESRDDNPPPAESTISIAVLIPTWKRPDDLDRCLEALSKQRRPADSIVVAWREGDATVHGVLDRWSRAIPLRRVEARVPGVVEAMNAGLDAIEGVDVVAITDDDSAPHPEWLERMEAIYRDHPEAVAVGGRDLVHVHGGVLPERDVPVGTLSWFGRSKGSHHEGMGPLRAVDFLKGVNCSFRLSATDGRRFDRRLLGTGAQQHWEMGFFLPLRDKGIILFDPSLRVDHFPAQRHDEDQRDTFNWTATYNGGHNETLVILENLPFLSRPLFLLWALLVGHSAHPGMLQGLRQLLKGVAPRVAIGRTAATCRGRLAALATSVTTTGNKK